MNTIDHINRWIELEVCDERGQAAMVEGSSWGADWAQARKKNLDIVKKFQTLCKSLGRNLVLISHAKSTVITDGKSQLGPELPRGLAYALTASADVIGYAMASKEDGKFYSIPKENPFNNHPNKKILREIYVYGLRQPWRFSFDSANGDLWVGDVGQNRFEEVSIVRAGENHGWNVYEGFELFSTQYRKENSTFIPPIISFV